MTYHDTLKASIDKEFAQSGTAAKTYFKLLNRLNAGKWPTKYVDVFVQKNSGRYDVYDAWVFGQMHARAVKNELTILEVPFGQEPFGDKVTEGNNEKLTQLPAPFRATFMGGAGDNDGNVSWDEDIFVGDAQKHWPPRTVSLEVGVTRSATTWLHLMQSGGLARWPYGSKSLYLLSMERPTLRSLFRKPPKK